MLADVCATRYSALLVVGDEREKRIVEAKRPCARIAVEVFAHDASGPALGPLRLFKVGALHMYCNHFPGGTLALDNDVALKITHVDALFAIFDAMRQQSKAYGFGLDGRCVPEEHREAGVPGDFCERNSGLVFFGDAVASKEMTRAWREEMRSRPTADGHDQGPCGGFCGRGGRRSSTSPWAFSAGGAPNATASTPAATSRGTVTAASGSRSSRTAPSPAASATTSSR